MLRSLFLLLALWAGTAAAATAADPVFPPGQRIGLVPPAGMSVSPRFAGFDDDASKAGISLVELPLPAYESVEKSMFDRPPPGLTVLTRGMLPFTDGIGFLIVGTSVISGTPMHQWFLLARSAAGRNTDVAALVTAVVPDTALSVYSDKVVRAALATVAFRPPPTAERVAMLPFKLHELAGFRIMQALPPGSMILTDGPTDDITKQPYMIVTIGTGAPAEADGRARFARDLLSTAPLKDITIISTDGIRISNLPGIEVRATATDLRGDPIKLVQWVRFGVGGYLRVIGVVAPDGWDKMFDRFRAVRDGIELH